MFHKNCNSRSHVVRLHIFRQNETPEEKEARCAANRERVKVNRHLKRLLNPEEEELQRASKAKKARENRQAETPEERFLSQTLDKERKRFEPANETEAKHQARLEGDALRKRVDRANDKEAEHQARLLDQQQRQEETEGINHRVGAEAEAQRHPSPLHDTDNNIQLESEELVLAINLNHEEVKQGRAKAESERQPAPLHHADYDVHLQAEVLRLALTERQANALS